MTTTDPRGSLQCCCSSSTISVVTASGKDSFRSQMDFSILLIDRDVLYIEMSYTQRCMSYTQRCPTYGIFSYTEMSYTQRCHIHRDVGCSQRQSCSRVLSSTRGGSEQVQNHGDCIAVQLTRLMVIHCTQHPKIRNVRFQIVIEEYVSGCKTAMGYVLRINLRVC